MYTAGHINTATPIQLPQQPLQSVIAAMPRVTEQDSCAGTGAGAGAGAWTVHLLGDEPLEKLHDHVSQLWGDSEGPNHSAHEQIWQRIDGLQPLDGLGDSSGGGSRGSSSVRQQQGDLPPPPRRTQQHTAAPRCVSMAQFTV
jgi:hypothetical protein